MRHLKGKGAGDEHKRKSRETRPTAEKICKKEMSYNFFHDQKRDVTSSVTSSKRFECFSPFLSLIGKFLLFYSTILYTVLSLSNYYSIFKAKANKN